MSESTQGCDCDDTDDHIETDLVELSERWDPCLHEDKAELT
jgi:hypothetical protein